MRILHRMLIAFGCVVGVGVIQSAATLISVQSLTGKRGPLHYLFLDKPGRLDVPY